MVVKRAEPRSHWLLLLLGAFALAAMLLLDGFARGVVGEAPRTDPPPRPPAPAEVTSGGPVVSLDGDRPRSLRMPARTIALTFDDGPDPKWTPRLLDLLRRHNARATFFATGTHIAQHPELTRRILREGHEIGSHTYTHIDMATAPAWRNRLELDLTQRALAGTAGVHTRLLRMPYSSRPDGLTDPEWRAARQAGTAGYVVVLTDRDTEDWARPGAQKIVERSLAAERRGEGAIVMLHDSGGDRAPTVAAVEQVLRRLSPQGYRFTTVTEALRLPRAEASASLTDRMIGKTLVAAQRTGGWLTRWLQVAFVAVGVLCVLRLVVLLVCAHVHMRRVRRHRRVFPATMPPVSVVVPAYNEEAGIAATVRSLLDNDYPGPVEVVVVDDGSSDRTAEIVESLALPGVRLVRKPNGGKPSALNAGIAAARAEILVLVDGDTVFQRDTLRNLVFPLRDPEVGAVSGNAKVANRRGVLGRWQHIEYVIGFNLDRRMFDVFRCMPTIPGAIGAFRRRALVSVGGVQDDTLAEDTDLTMALGRAGWRVVYEENALAWTEAPASLRQLWRQRYRWCYGTVQAMWKHRDAVLERGRAGRYGRRSLTYLTVFQVILPLLAPAVDLFALYGVAFMDPTAPALMWLAFTTVQVAAGGYALWLDGERIGPLWTLPLQQIVYRQLLYLVVIQSLVTAMLGVRLRWQVIRRTGTFSDVPGTPSELPAR
ncbi:glycosyltransferase [Actinomadura kijaniata]|uniref:Cellulose synthase/poly-beta-1,6-N-acetylglucosamine synthase-like glycosyltransferase/peptidoglycan/xylan/chitin deacetylase (PgdA/CDA1 family) n=1 Tax=Actinomadura namibiensis TaxID=182080 RepID=A0A7W3QKF0_ACTNM|nr:glycosyltransferase [Actinomadura namibiensis]MBA8950336.1 cellulose synthase/poly-beta-1,6-N-acetylglucosamine synthase-like glycosyltransferase/peptidoglycan/xylan/chitin deacetylase (PgdA/CDA1 family) [Actinomadura namibiensis]